MISSADLALALAKAIYLCEDAGIKSKHLEDCKNVLSDWKFEKQMYLEQQGKLKNEH